ncbi:MAG: KTSC domain-containing protein [Luteimonas sp.]
MRREAVDSEALRSVGYDPRGHVLEIEFANGSVYRYQNVPEHLYAALMTAASHGEFFADHVRDAGFEFERID